MPIERERERVIWKRKEHIDIIMIDIGMEENEVGMEGIYMKAVGFHDYIYIYIIIIIIINKLKKKKKKKKNVK
jgi:hypothetical protein